MPITAFIGVRISWLIVARNELFASLAASAAARASCASLEQPRVLQRDADVRGDRAEQPLVVGVVRALARVLCTLITPSASPPTRDRHAEVGKRAACRRRRRRAAFDCAVGLVD